MRSCPHAGHKLSAALLTALVGFERGFELCRHKIDSVACSLKLIRLRVIYRIIEIARANAVNAGNKSVERIGNVREQLTCETDISENNRQQQCHTDSADIYPYEGFKALEQALVLLNGDVHVVQAQTDLRQIFYLQYIYMAIPVPRMSSSAAVTSGMRNIYI